MLKKLFKWLGLTLLATLPSGTWKYSCHVNDHISAGMKTTYTIDPA